MNDRAHSQGILRIAVSKFITSPAGQTPVPVVQHLQGTYTFSKIRMQELFSKLAAPSVDETQRRLVDIRIQQKEITIIGFIGCIAHQHRFMIDCCGTGQYMLRKLLFPDGYPVIDTGEQREVMRQMTGGYGMKGQTQFFSQISGKGIVVRIDDRGGIEMNVFVILETDRISRRRIA